MRLPDQEPMAEIYKSLRALGESEVRWQKLVCRFHTRLDILVATDELNPSPPPFTEPPSAS